MNVFHRGRVLFLISVTTFLFMASVIKVIAGDFEEGQLAYSKGDFQSAFTHWKQAEAQGNIQASYNLGLLYMSGQGVKKDVAIAIKSFETAAIKGLPEAQYNYGYMLMNGIGVPKDQKKSIKFVTLAAEQGLVAAQGQLGVWYAQGVGVKANLDEAERWLEMAAKQGEPKSIQSHEFIRKSKPKVRSSFPKIFAVGTLIVLIGAGIFAHRKGQSGFGFFFLLLSGTILVLCFIGVTPKSSMTTLVQLGVLTSSLGAIYAQAKGKTKWKYVSPGLLVVFAALFNDVAKVMK